MPNFEEYRNEVKQKYNKQQNYLSEDSIYDVDHLSTFMKKLKSRKHPASSTNDERRQVLPS
jgi:hypothetical protein